MATYRYCSKMEPSPDDPSIVEPLLLQVRPNLSASVTTRETDPQIPEGYVVVLVPNCTANDHRVHLAIPFTSEWK